MTKAELHIPPCSECKNCLLPFPINPLHKIGDEFQLKEFLSFKKDEFLYRIGEKPNGFFCIYSGTVKITRPVTPGRDSTVHVAGDGEIIGLNSIKEGQHIYSAIATKETYACLIPLSEILELLKVLSMVSEKIRNSKY